MAHGVVNYALDLVIYALDLVKHALDLLIYALNPVNHAFQVPSSRFARSWELPPSSNPLTDLALFMA